MKFSTDEMIDKLVVLGRVNISTFHDVYKVDILACDIEINGQITPCSNEGPTLNEALLGLLDKMTKADKIMYGRFTSRLKHFVFEGETLRELSFETDRMTALQKGEII